jgi:hypothetical protein
MNLLSELANLSMEILENVIPNAVYPLCTRYRGCINKTFHFDEDANLRNIRRMEARYIPDSDRSLLARPVLLGDVRGNQRKFPSMQITCVAFGRVWCGRPDGVAAGHRGYLPS